MKKFLVLAAFLALSSHAFASLKDAVKVFESGKWTVLRDISKMTDKVSCTGVQANDYGKQLSSDALYITVRGGVSAVTMRFDDAPALALRLGTKMEKEVRAIILEGFEFDSAVKSKRLRMQVSTLISGVQEFDIDLTGIADAFENIKQGCPVQTAVPVSPVTPSPSANKAEAGPICSPEVISKMQRAGVNKAQLAQVCGIK